MGLNLNNNNSKYGNTKINREKNWGATKWICEMDVLKKTIEKCSKNPISKDDGIEKPRQQLR